MIKNYDFVVVVPDIHGRTFWKKLLKEEPKLPIIFLGDYTDSYPHENISEEDCYKNFLDILDYKDKYQDKVTLLIGNHELHYFNPEMKCNRYSWEYSKKYNELLTYGMTKNTFQLCKKIDKYFFIHAGILNSWYQKHKLNFEKLGKRLEEQLNKYFEINKEAFFEISYLRYGLHESGSPIWADIREFEQEKIPFYDDIIQIVGHTQINQKDPLIVNNVRVLDNKDIHILNLTTGNFI